MASVMKQVESKADLAMAVSRLAALPQELRDDILPVRDQVQELGPFHIEYKSFKVHWLTVARMKYIDVQHSDKQVYTWKCELRFYNLYPQQYIMAYFLHYWQFD